MDISIRKVYLYQIYLIIMAIIGFDLYLSFLFMFEGLFKAIFDSFNELASSDFKTFL